MPEASQRLPTASVAERFRVLAQWFRDAPSQAESPELLEYNLKSHCAKAGWVLIAAFQRKAIPVRKEWHDRIAACLAARSKGRAYDRDEHMTVSSVLAKNLFLELIVEWLMHEDAAIYEVPLWKKAVEIPGPLPDGNFHELRGKFYVSDPDDEGKLPLHTKSRGLVRLYGKMYSTEPMAAETFADACTLLAGLVGDGENKMADAPKANGQTSAGNDGDRTLPTTDEWRAEILAGQADELLRMDRAAGLIRMSDATIYRMIRAGLPCSPPITADCPRKARLMWRSDVLAWHRGTHPGMKTSKK